MKVRAIVYIIILIFTHCLMGAVSYHLGVNSVLYETTNYWENLVEAHSSGYTSGYKDGITAKFP